MKKSDKKKAKEAKEEDSLDVVIWDGTKNSKLNHFVRLLFMKEKDRNKELNQISNRNRKHLEKKAEKTMEVTEFTSPKEILLWGGGIFLLIILICIAYAVFVSLIPGIAVTILVAIVLPVEFYPIMRKSLYRIVYNEKGFSVLYGNKLECEYTWEDVQSQSEIYKFAGKSIYFETVKGRVYVHRTHYGAYPFVKRVQDEYRRIHGRGIPVLNIKK